MAPLKVLDLYCGGGGLALGFVRCGCTVVGVDRDPAVLAHARRNMPEPHEWIHADIGPTTPLPTDVDVIVGGPPCQPYSQASRKRLFEEDPRNGVDVFLDAVSRLTPRAFLMEQSPELPKRAEYFAACLARVAAMGYECTHGVVRMELWGVPQKRRRLVLVGLRRDLCFPGWGDRMLVPPNARPLTVGDVLPDPPCTPPLLEERVLDRIDRLERNTGCRHARVLDRRRPSRTLTVQNVDHATNDCLRFAFDPKTHLPLDALPLAPPGGNRAAAQRLLTIREAAALHTFPPTWSWDADRGGRRYVDARVIGNSVPPAFSHELAARLLGTLL